ncbi:metal-dependent hydrolase [Rubrivirga sp.]|uniref:metal-dependent hydrolase n=1 Tax=Rubrivirga sp. TaxID=1885344 RepID=UPI003B5209EA
MDSLTQAVLGAAVGEAVAGPRIGRRAALWGAVAGTLPDLDVLAYPLLDPASQLVVHRGTTHGLAFGLVVGAALGWAGWRLARWRARATGREPGTPGLWIALWTLALVTHPLLDVFTVYGTQLLAPFSRHPFAVGSVFIIDPLVTVPLAVGLGVALWAGACGLARRAALVGLMAAVAYLGLGVALQQQARATVDAALAGRGVSAERVLVAAGPLSSLIWRGAALADGRFHPFSLHVLDQPGDVRFEAPLPVADLAPDLAASRTGETLLWFSRGWLARDAADGLVVADVRFGRLGLDEADPFVFRWRIDPEPPFPFSQLPSDAALDDGEGGRLWARVFRTADGR